MRLARKKPFISWCLLSMAIGILLTGTSICYPLYFTNYLSIDKASGSADWALLLTLSSLVGAILCPFVGASVDASGRRKLFLATLLILAMTIIASFYFIKPTTHYRHLFMLLMIFLNIVITTALVVYSATLPYLQVNDDLGKASNLGIVCSFLGYIAGLVCGVLFENTLSLFYFYSWFLPLTFLLLSIPFWLYYTDKEKATIASTNLAKNTLQAVAQTVKSLRNKKNIIIYIIARIMILDGFATYSLIFVPFVNKQFNMAQSSISLTVATLFFPAIVTSSFIWGWLDDKISAKKVLLISCPALYFFINFSIFTHTAYLFKLTVTIACLFISPLFSSFRSLLTRITPANKLTEITGFTTLTNMASTFIGTGTYYLAYQLLHNQRLALVISLMFVPLGLIVLAYVKEEKADTW